MLAARPEKGVLFALVWESSGESQIKSFEVLVMPTPKMLIRAPQAPERRAAARMTGRYLITFEPEAHREISTRLNKVGLKSAPPLPRVATSAKPMPDGSQLTREMSVLR
jgi:hypothetical protein